MSPLAVSIREIAVEPETYRILGMVPGRYQGYPRKRSAPSSPD